MLHGLGFTCQKPAKQAKEHDDKPKGLGWKSMRYLPRAAVNDGLKLTPDCPPNIKAVRFMRRNKFSLKSLFLLFALFALISSLYSYISHLNRTQEITQLTQVVRERGPKAGESTWSIPQYCVTETRFRNGGRAIFIDRNPLTWCVVKNNTFQLNGKTLKAPMTQDIALYVSADGIHGVAVVPKSSHLRSLLENSEKWTYQDCELVWSLAWDEYKTVLKGVQSR